jgi:hypothetical protein
MSTGQLAAPHGRIRGPIVIVLLVGAFAVGGLAGFSLPRAAGSDGRAAAGATIPAVAVNSMSDVAERAFAGSTTGAVIPGVAVNSMSDAADRAFRGLASGAAIPGVAVNNMSDAADRAFAVLAAGAPVIPGAAVNSMSDAAERAFAGLSTGAAIPGVAVSMSDAADRAFAGQQAFHLEKVCDTNTHCVVTSSSFKPIAVGTEINYSGPDADHLVAVFGIKNGSATGQCAIGSIFADPSRPGTCRFDTGTGRLAQFHLDVAVAFDGSNWFWDGTYWFGNGGPRRP